LQMQALNTRMYNNHLYINIQLGTSHKVKGGWAGKNRGVGHYF
jgi:hypothetical protein